MSERNNELNKDDWLTRPNLAWQPFVPDRDRVFGVREAAHLFRRAGFGGSIAEINRAVAAGLEATLDQLFGQIDEADSAQELEKTARLVTGSADATQLAAWWLLRMLKSNRPFVEKMTLFWHGHFATGADKVQNARAMFRQNQLLRKHAFGKFEPFVQAISSDVAMLVYLDSEENRRTRPNENYARELMELFCLGTGNYSEQDIKEVARCFTGWSIKKNQFRFYEHQHDKKMKSFLGVTGNLDGNEAISVVLKQKAAAEFIARKLIRFFVVDEIELTSEFVQPVAVKLRDTEFDIRQAMSLILSSNFFFSSQAMGRKIKSPVELAIGFLRYFDASTNVLLLANRLKELGQLPFYPPNVKGWQGGKDWINASTILGRANLIGEILRHQKTKFRAGALASSLKAAGVSLNDLTDEVFKQMCASFFAVVPKTNASDGLLSQLQGVTDDPVDLIASLASMPEYQMN